MPGSLQTFIRHARDKGLDYPTIRALLADAGWKERDIVNAMASESLVTSVPKPAGGGGARDAFLHLLTFASLYVVVSSVILLLYTYLDSLYPDSAWGEVYAEAALASVRYAIAAIFIGLPLFLLLTATLDRVILRTANGQVHPVGKWLTYLTMFLAAAIIVGDLIALVYFFLDGSLTTRFLLKVAVLLVTSGGVLSYYVLRLCAATKPQLSRQLSRLLAAVALPVVAAAVVLGFDMAGSPFTARLRRLDEKRIEDLRAIHYTLQQMVTKPDNNSNSVTVARALPKTIDEILEYQRTKESNHRFDVADPQIGEKYGYTVTGDKTYELMATFDTVRDKKPDSFWNHPAGKHSFKFNAESPP